jgi:diguanylate cyclase (GGDEF)-like protein/PAS domain S-box-containing protein
VLPRPHRAAQPRRAPDVLRHRPAFTAAVCGTTLTAVHDQQQTPPTGGPPAPGDRAGGASAEHTRILFEAAVDAVVAIDQQGVIEAANPATETLFGWPVRELTGRNVRMLMPEPDRSAHDGHLRRYLRTGERRIIGIGRQVTGLRRDGSTFPLRLSVGEGVIDGRRVYVGTMADLTARVALEHRLAEAVREQAALSRVATLAVGSARSDMIMNLIAREVADLLEAQAAIVVRFEGAHGVVAGVSGVRLMEMDDRVALTGESPMSRLARTGVPTREDDIPALARRDPLFPASIEPDMFTGAVAVPIRVDGGLWGCLMVLTGAPAPPVTEARLAHFAEVAGVAIQAAGARQRLASLAATDPLTGLANHRAFHDALLVEVSRARRHGRALSVVVLDLDHFKQVNDVHGHQAGDAVLTEVARRMRAQTRAGEVIGRLGGEEFGWIIPEATGMQAMYAAERMRQAVSARSIAPVGRLTVSAGACDIGRATGAADLLEHADAALYWAKAQGRDRAFLYSAETIASLSASERADRAARAQALAGLRALARVVDAKDPSTQRHSERVADIACEMAKRDGWTPDRVATLREAALLHDVGKTVIPDAVLFKPGRLTDEEYEQVKLHAEIGARIAGEVLTEEQARWIHHHHERWDGSGYPGGLAGRDIPDGARVIAVADAFDVMVMARTYKVPMSIEDAMDEVRRMTGTQFCPYAVPLLESLLRLGMLQQIVAAAPAGA